MKSAKKHTAGAAGRSAPTPCCGAIHEEKVLSVQQDLPAEELLYDLADFFKVFGDTTRVRILESLRRAELCVCDLAANLGASPSAVSHQLKILRLSNLVKMRKAGKSAYYSLSDFHVADILERGLDHVKEGL
jgi:ArsR family transcriptional regulator